MWRATRLYVVFSLRYALEASGSYVSITIFDLITATVLPLKRSVQVHSVRGIPSCLSLSLFKNILQGSLDEDSIRRQACSYTRR
jgi:hypothetical protein